MDIEAHVAAVETHDGIWVCDKIFEKLGDSLCFVLGVDVICKGVQCNNHGAVDC